MNENEQRMASIISALIKRFCTVNGKIALSEEEIEDAPELSTWEDFQNDRLVLQVRMPKK